MKKNVLKIMLGSVILEVILVCLFILIGIFDDMAWRSLGSVAIIFGYSIPCLFYSKIYDNERYKFIATSGAIVVCISALISILWLWNFIDNSEILIEIVATFNVIIYTLAFVSWLLSYVSVNNLLKSFKEISISLITVLSFFNIIIIWSSFPEDFLLRLYYVLSVLTIGSSICTLILIQIYKKEIVKVSQGENISQINSNNDYILSNSAQHQNLQSVDNSQEQNLNSFIVQPTMNTTQNTNLKENIENNSLNNEDINGNNSSENNI